MTNDNVLVQLENYLKCEQNSENEIFICKKSSAKHSVVLETKRKKDRNYLERDVHKCFKINKWNKSKSRYI